MAAAAAAVSSPAFPILAWAWWLPRRVLLLGLLRLLLWLMGPIPWLKDGRLAKNTRSVAAKRGTREVFSPTGSCRPDDDGLSPMNGPQPLGPSCSTGNKHQGTTGHGLRPTTATVGRTPWFANYLSSSRGLGADCGGAAVAL